MSSAGTTLPPHSQWKPNEIQLFLRLSKESLKTAVPFFSLISMDKGFALPSSTAFAITEVRGDIITVQISIHNFDNRERDHIAFYTSSNLRVVSTICSKLNMADALKCEITATLVRKDEVCFSIVPTSKTAENRLLSFLRLFE